MEFIVEYLDNPFYYSMRLTCCNSYFSFTKQTNLKTCMCTIAFSDVDLKLVITNKFNSYLFLKPTIQNKNKELQLVGFFLSLEGPLLFK